MPTYTIEINEAQRAHFRAPFGKAAREALARLREHDGGTRYNGDDDDAGERACCLVASWKPHDSDCPHAVAVAEFDRLLAALGAAQGEAVLGSVQSGSVTIPFWVIDYAQKIELFMKVNGVDAWALGGIQSRDLPPPQAPPDLVTQLDHARRRIGQLTIQLGEVMKAPPAAVLEVPTGVDRCPFTGRPFFMNIEHPELGVVATYGGPFDSYTLPQRDDDDPSYYHYHFDHDKGYWEDGVESIGMVLVDDQLYTSEDDPAELHAEIQRLKTAPPAAVAPQLEHKASSDCWCEPELDSVDPDTGAKVWIHREVH